MINAVVLGAGMIGATIADDLARDGEWEARSVWAR